MGAHLIRRADRTDLDAILRIEACWKTTPGWTRAQFERELGLAHSYLCVAIEVGEPFASRAARSLVGYAGLWLLPPQAQLLTIAVRPDRTRRGVGRALMSHIESVATTAGCSVVTLEVSSANTAAIRLYEARGYRVVGRRLKYYNDRSDALLMDRRLPTDRLLPTAENLPAGEGPEPNEPNQPDA